METNEGSYHSSDNTPHVQGSETRSDFLRESDSLEIVVDDVVDTGNKRKPIRTKRKKLLKDKSIVS